MSWVADKLTAKAVQGIAAALLVLSLGLGVQVWVQGKRLDVAKADVGAAESARDAARTERDAWKSKTDDALAANRAMDVVLGQLQAAAEEQQRMADQQAQQAARAIAASKAKAAAADKELAEFRRVYGQRPADCEAALKSLDRVCPAWRY